MGKKLGSGGLSTLWGIIKNYVNGKLFGGVPLSTGSRYAVCTTDGDVAAKTVSISGFTLSVGSEVLIRFTNTNSASVSSITLNVSGTGAKPIRHKNAVLSNAAIIAASQTYAFVYDGTYWQLEWSDFAGNIVTGITRSGTTFTAKNASGYTLFTFTQQDNNTTYTPAALGFGYGTCATAAATAAKVVTLSNYALVTGGYVTVKFTYAVPASATMNINSKGGKPIYYKGSAISANIIRAGDTATFVYNGSQYVLLSIDTNIDLLTSLRGKDVVYET